MIKLPVMKKIPLFLLLQSSFLWGQQEVPCLEINATSTGFTLSLETASNAEETTLFQSTDLVTWTPLQTFTGGGVSETVSLPVSANRIFFQAETTTIFTPPPAPVSLGNVWCVGDSWTDCYEDLTWRRQLFQDLTAEGVSFDFIGTEVSPASCETGEVFDRDHEGVGGITAAEVLAEMPTLLDTVDTPDTVLLMIGGNDIFFSFFDPGNPPAINLSLLTTINTILATDFTPLIAEVVDNIDQMIDLIRAENPNAVFHLGSYGDVNLDLDASTRPEVPIFFLGAVQSTINQLQIRSEEVVDELRDAIQALAQQKSTADSPIHFVDHQVGWNRNVHGIPAPEIHPNNAGMLRLAENWLQSIEENQF